MTSADLMARLKAVQNEPCNLTCLDCGDRKPTWASLIVPPSDAPIDSPILGALCCYRCSGMHRSLGTHISFVRSITLDEWKEKEIIAMEKGGNQRVNLIFESKLKDGSAKPNPTSPPFDLDSFCRSKYFDRKFYESSAYTVVLKQISANGPMRAGSLPNPMTTARRKQRPMHPTRMMVRQNSMPLIGRTGGANGPFRIGNEPVLPVVDVIKESINDMDFDFFSKSATATDDWFVTSPPTKKSPSKSASRRVSKDELATTWHPLSPRGSRVIEKSYQTSEGGFTSGHKDEGMIAHRDEKKNGVGGTSRSSSRRMTGKMMIRQNSSLADPNGENSQSTHKESDTIDSSRKSRSSSTSGKSRSSSTSRRKDVKDSLSTSLHTSTPSNRRSNGSELDGRSRHRQSKDTTNERLERRRENTFEENHHESTLKESDGPLRESSKVSHQRNLGDELKAGSGENQMVNNQSSHRKREFRNANSRNRQRGNSTREEPHENDERNATGGATNAILISELVGCLHGHNGIGTKAPEGDTRDLGHPTSRESTDEEGKNKTGPGRLHRGQTSTGGAHSNRSRSRSRSKSRSRKSNFSRRQASDATANSTSSGTRRRGDKGGGHLTTSNSPVRLHSEAMIPQRTTNDNVISDDQLNGTGSSHEHSRRVRGTSLGSRRNRSRDHLAQRKEASRSRSKSKEAGQRRFRRVTKSSNQDIPGGSLRGDQPRAPDEMNEKGQGERGSVGGDQKSTKRIESPLSTQCGIEKRLVQIQTEQYLQSPTEASDIVDDDDFIL